MRVIPHAAFADVPGVRLAWPILAVFAARFMTTALTFPDVDGDLTWQRWLGRAIRASARLPHALGAETYSAPGAAWVPQEWLFATFASLHGSGPLDGLAAGAALSAIAALALGGVRAARGGAAPLAVAAALACAGFALFEAFGVRAQVFTWPLLALFLVLLDLESPAAYWAVAVAVVWANLHASVMLAAPLALAAAAGSYLDERWSARTRRSLLVALGALAATCCTPLGTALPRYALAVFGSPFKRAIVEWQPPGLADASFAFGALPLLLALCMFGVARWRDRGIVVLTAGLMFTAERNVPLFALACFPLVARSLPFRLAGRPEAAPGRGALFVPLVSLAAAAALTLLLIGRARTQALPADRLGATIAAVRALPGDHRVFCADFSWCSAFLGAPRDRVFLDGRADPYPQAVWDDFATIVNVRPGWDGALRGRGTDVVLTTRGEPLAAALALSADWRRVYANDAYAVWTLPRPLAAR